MQAAANHGPERVQMSSRLIAMIQSNGLVHIPSAKMRIAISHISQRITLAPSVSIPDGAM